MPTASPKYLVLGEILRPHAVKGELRLRLLTAYPERINKLKTVYLGGDPDDPEVKSYKVQHMRMNRDYGLLKLAGVDSREQADLLRELFVMVDIKHAVPLEDDEVYLYQLIGLRVQSDSGEELGVLKEVLETGANDVYIVDSPTYGEILIPVTSETIVKTDPDAGIVVVHLLDGLLPPK